MASRKVISSVLLGVAIGVLIAPHKGSETRKKLSKSINDLSDYIKDIINDTRDEVNDIANKGIDKVEKMESQINDTLLT